MKHVLKYTHIILWNESKIINTTLVAVGEQNILLESAISALEKLCRDVHFTCHQVILAPITAQLERWTVDNGDALASDLPDYSFTPQEFITQVTDLSISFKQLRYSRTHYIQSSRDWTLVWTNKSWIRKKTWPFYECV